MDEAEQARQIAAAQRWISTRWVGVNVCPVCHTNSWNVGPVFQLLEYSGGGIVLGGPILPVFPVTCTVCGNTLLINALLSGVLPGEWVPQPPPAAPGPES